MRCPPVRRMFADLGSATSSLVETDTFALVAQGAELVAQCRDVMLAQRLRDPDSLGKSLEA